MSNILRVKNIHVDYSIGHSVFKRKQIRAVNDVSFDLKKGEALAIVGESGSGKSTCLKAISKLINISSGEITYNGESIFAKDEAFSRKNYARKVQMIFQDPFSSLNPVQSIKHHLARPIKIHNPKISKAELQEKIHALLTRVGLTPALEFADKYPHQMSGGQKQRVAIARALAVDAQVILADEPISMLDVSIRIGILNLMEDMKANEGIAFLYITHDISTAAYFAERTAVMYVGHMVEWGDSQRVTCFPQHPYTKLLIDSIPDPKKRGKKINQAKGEIPQFTPESFGCPFASRCAQVMPICQHKMPAITQVQDNHFVRCHAL